MEDEIYVAQRTETETTPHKDGSSLDGLHPVAEDNDDLSAAMNTVF